MKLVDCFMYFDEDVILDLRLNILNPFIDYFVIVESTFNHKGEKRKLKFDINKYKKFENKIIYLIFDEEPSGIEKVFEVNQELVEKTEWFDDEIIGTKHGDFFVKRSINYSKRTKSITSDDLF